MTILHLPRRIAAFAAVALVVMPAAAHSDEQGIRRMYDLAQKCFVASGYVSDVFRKRGDTANAALFDARSSKAFNTAKGAALFLKLSPDEVSADFDKATDRELPKLIGDPQYLRQVAAECKRIELM